MMEAGDAEERNSMSSGRVRGRWPFLGLLFAVGFLLSGCARGGPDGAGGQIRVATTIGMIADIVENVGGERVQVTGLMGPGVDPHLYKASAGDVRTLSRADLIFYNGLHLEAAMGEVLEEMGARKRTAAVSDGIDPERFIVSREFIGSRDPHIWFDVTLWMEAAEHVAEVLADHDPDGADLYRENLARYRSDLEALDAWVRERVSTVPEERRVLVTAHDAFNYFGRAYDFDVRGLQGISTVSEAGTADVQQLARFIVERRIPAIFAETSVSERSISAVRAAVRARGVEVKIGGSLFSDAMGSAGTPEGTYVGMIRHNVNAIVEGLLDEVAMR